jgi:hypothetical protein
MFVRSTALLIRTAGGTVSRPVNGWTSPLPELDTCHTPGLKNGAGTASGELTGDGTGRCPR